MITNQTVTLFNAVYDDATRSEIYIPTVIESASFYESIGNSGAFDGMSNADGVTIRIPIAADTDAKTYIPDVEFASLDKETAKKYWTLQKDDLIVPKKVTDAEEFESQEEIRQMYGNFYTIKTFVDNTRRGSSTVRHWKVIGA